MPQIYIQYYKDENSITAIQKKKKLEQDNFSILHVVGVRLLV